MMAIAKSTKKALTSVPNLGPRQHRPKNKFFQILDQLSLLPGLLSLIELACSLFHRSQRFTANVSGLCRRVLLADGEMLAMS